MVAGNSNSDNEDDKRSYEPPVTRQRMCNKITIYQPVRSTRRTCLLWKTVLLLANAEIAVIIMVKLWFRTGFYHVKILRLSFVQKIFAEFVLSLTIFSRTQIWNGLEKTLSLSSWNHTTNIRPYYKCRTDLGSSCTCNLQTVCTVRIRFSSF